MKTLIIYDNKGRIYWQSSDMLLVPEGLQYIRATIPIGQYAEKVDLTDSNNPVLVLKKYLASAETQLRADVDYLLLIQGV